MKRATRRLWSLLILFSMLTGSLAQAEANYHLVGWTNVVLPGGGALLMSDYRAAAGQFVFETGTFVWGYSLSARTPFTLDGVPESLPTAGSQVLQKQSVVSVCALRDAQGKCLRYRRVRKNSQALAYDGSPQDITKPLYADILQEIGLKTHIVNVFDYYRRAAAEQGVDLRAAHIDNNPTNDLFLSPFDHHRVFDPWVSVPLGLTAVALFVAYRTAGDSVQPLPPFNTRSTRLYEATYLGVFPLGSAAPEEMFYRGFLQSEIYSLSKTPWISVPASTALYALSHSSDAMLGAAVSGLYLGYMTYHDHGDLRRGIAYHFWSDVMSGIYALALLKLGQKQGSDSAPASLTMNFDF